MDVIIVSKTQMSNAVCVGGLLENGRSVRLLTRNGHNQDTDTQINIGHIYSITFSERHDKRPPHIEDILGKYVGIQILLFILKGNGRLSFRQYRCKTLVGRY